MIKHCAIWPTENALFLKMPPILFAYFISGMWSFQMDEVIEPPKKKTKAKPSQPADLATIEKGQSLVNFCRQAMPDQNSKGQPLGTYDNLKILLDVDRVVLRYNVMKKETEIIIPGQKFTSDNYYNASATWIMNRMRKIEMTTGNFMDLVEFLADQHVYNPVEDWIKSKSWDGKSRLADLFATITLTYSEDQPAMEAFIYKWML